MSTEPVAVVSLPAALPAASFYRRIIDVDAFDVVTVGARSHLLYHVSSPGRDASFVDPIDGEVLVGLRYFCGEAEARGWIAEQAR
jgi:hypothetical protein